MLSGLWHLIGGFNSVLSPADKKGGNVVSSSSKNSFRDLVDNLGLIDLGFIGEIYTWYNRRGGVESIQERLDCGFANDSWRIMFQHATITT